LLISGQKETLPGVVSGGQKHPKSGGKFAVLCIGDIQALQVALHFLFVNVK